MEGARQEDDAQRSVNCGAAAAEEQLNSIVDTAQEKIVNAVRPATETVQSFAEQQKAMGADQIRGVAQAAHRAAEEVERQLPGVARSVHKVASRLDVASSSLREQSVEELIETLSSFGREQPAMVFGGAVLAGFALSRFLKASSTR
jgi:ABC-type transporter Mla subunit MlaD